MSNAWVAVSIALMPPLLIAVIGAGIRAIHLRLVAFEVATSLILLLLVTLSFAFDQPSSIDLALTLALLTLPGTLILALFLERWL